MSTALLVLAGVVALLNVPFGAGLLAWGLLGGDGTPHGPADVVLAAAVLGGAVFTALACLRALSAFSLMTWRLTWVAPAAALVALAVAWHREDEPVRDRLVSLWIPASLAVPPVLLWLSGVVGKGA